MLRGILGFAGTVGGLFFGLLFVASFASPGFVERVGRELIRLQVQNETQEYVRALDESFLAGHAARLIRKNQESVRRARAQLQAGLHTRIAAVIAEMQNLDCECRDKLESGLQESLQAGLLGEIDRATQAQERLTRLIRAKYMETTAQLAREFRIFTGANALVFAAIFLAALRKLRAGPLLLPAAGLLLLSCGTTAALYLFNQNWLHTLVFGDFTGFAYLGYMGTVFALLCDIFFNHGAITASLINGFLHSVGSALSVAGC
jgi:hypothetical protein